MFEMPNQVKKLDLNEFGASIRTQAAHVREFAGTTVSISDEYLRLVLQNMLANQPNIDGASTINTSGNSLTVSGSGGSSIISSNSSTNSSTSYYYYLNFVIRDLLMSSKFSAPSFESAFPKDIESYFKVRIGKCIKYTQHITSIFN